MGSMIRRTLDNGANLTCICTDKFKTSVMSMSLVMPLAQLNCAEAAILPFVLRRGTRDFPTLTAIGAKLDELYGARIEPFVRKRGESLAFGMVADVIDARYARDEDNLTMAAAAMLGKLISQPLLIDGAFSKEAVEGEKLNLINRIKAMMNDKRSYALRRMYELMCENEPFGKNELGSQEEAEAVTPQSLYAAYLHFMQHAAIELFYCGSLPPEQVETAFNAALQGVERSAVTLPRSDVRRSCEKVRTVTEEMDVTQGKLTLGFRTGITAEDKDYPALILFNTCFGGSTSSRLFLNVREKMSLCYYASSQTEKLKGVMAVCSGIENDKFEVARDEILRQLQDIQHGGLSDDEIDSAKKTVTGALTAMKDSPLELENFYLAQAVGDLSYDLDDVLNRIQEIGRDEITAASQKAKLDTIYFLKGGAAK